MSPPRLPTILALVAILTGPPAFVAVSEWTFGPSPSLGIQIALQLLFCGLAANILWVVTRAERLTLASIGLRRPTVATVAWGALLALGALFVLPLITVPLVEVLGDDGVEQGLARLSPLPVWFRIVMGVTGGVVEETLYRGYAVERLIAITGRTWLGAAIAVIGFGLAHVAMWGIGFSLGAALPFGIAMTAFYLWRRDLVANMIAHSTALVVGLLEVR